MHSIREIVDKYNGELWTDVKENVLHINIVICGKI